MRPELEIIDLYDLYIRQRKRENTNVSILLRLALKFTILPFQEDGLRLIK